MQIIVQRLEGIPVGTASATSFWLEVRAASLNESSVRSYLSIGNGGQKVLRLAISCCFPHFRIIAGCGFVPCRASASSQACACSHCERRLEAGKQFRVPCGDIDSLKMEVRG